MSRVIIQADIDNFEFQLWAKIKRPDLIRKNFPVVVINPDNVILSLNSAGKRLGISRKEHSLQSVRQICVDNRVQLEVIKTAERFGRSDSFTPIKTTQRITQCILNFIMNKTLSATLEKAGSDEWFIDVTAEVTRRQNLPRLRESSEFPHILEVNNLVSQKKVDIDETCIQNRVVVMEHDTGAIFGKDLQFRVRTTYKDPRQEANLAGFLKESRLVYGAIIAQEIKEYLFQQTEFVVSFGVGENKLAAKLGCSTNKPEGITILTEGGFRRLATFHFMLTHLPGFGGIRGKNLEKELQQFHQIQNIPLNLILTTPFQVMKHMMEKYWPLMECESSFDELLRKCRGVDDSPVLPKTEDEKLSMTATFKGPFNESGLENFVYQLCLDFYDRMSYFQVTRTTITVNVKKQNGNGNGGENNEMIASAQVSNQLEINQQTQPPDILHFTLEFIRRQNLKIENISKIMFSCRK